MADGTLIQWSDATWNFLYGCSDASPGCTNCYAKRLAATRFRDRLPFAGVAEMHGGKPRWKKLPDGKHVRFDEAHFEDPLKWTRPRLIFVNSQSDTFHEDVPDELLDRVIAIAVRSPQHVFQFLTKRPERMARYFHGLRERIPTELAALQFMLASMPAGQLVSVEEYRRLLRPLRNCWLGTSTEDQERYDERMPYMAVLDRLGWFTWLSMEPLLGAIDMRDPGSRDSGPVVGNRWLQSLSWIVIGGESGPNARPCEIEWIRSIVRQAHTRTDMGRPWPLATFVKQIGAIPIVLEEQWRALHPTPLITPKFGSRVPEGFVALALAHSHGGSPDEWPGDLRIRELVRDVNLPATMREVVA